MYSLIDLPRFEITEFTFSWTRFAWKNIQSYTCVHNDNVYMVQYQQIRRTLEIVEKCRKIQKYTQEAHSLVVNNTKWHKTTEVFRHHFYDEIECVSCNSVGDKWWCRRPTSRLDHHPVMSLHGVVDLQAECEQLVSLYTDNMSISTPLLTCDSLLHCQTVHSTYDHYINIHCAV